MTFSLGDLGEISTLATAMGLIDDNIGQWLQAPGDHLSTMLADTAQRTALIDFVDNVLGGDQRDTDADGRIWLPIVKTGDGLVEVFIVVDESNADSVALGLGARFTTHTPTSHTSVHVPLFRAAKFGHTVADAIYLGQPGATITVDADVTVDAAPAVPGQAHLGALALGLHVPTDGTAPTFALTLRGLQLPGATAPRDLSLSASDLVQLEDAALQTVLGLVQAAADGLPNGPLPGLVGLLGLRSGSGVPDFPLLDLTTRGVAALSAWFEGVVADATSRTAWLGQLAQLLGLSPGAVGAAGVSFTLGSTNARIVLGVGVVPSATGHSVCTPTISVVVDQVANVTMRAEADLLRIDLGSGAVVALPRLAVYAHAGRRDGIGTPLLTGDPAVDAVRIGVALDEQRRPVFVLAADKVVIGTHSYETLDLSTPDALADSASHVVGDAIGDLLAKLGPTGPLLRTLLGLAPPTSDPTVPLVAIADFIRDPLGAVKSHWQTVLRDHPGAVIELLGSLRDLVADNTEALSNIGGDGSQLTPWRVPIVHPIELLVWTAGGNELDVSIAATLVVDTLGQRCTRIESVLSAGVVHVDLLGGHASFASRASASVTARARGSTQAFFDVGPFSLTADHVGLALDWVAGAPPRVDLVAPNLAVQTASGSVALALPSVGADGTLVLDDAGWAALEGLAALLAAAAPAPWVTSVVDALGWALDASNPSPHHLSLAALAAKPADAVVDWLMSLAVADDGPVVTALSALARLITGSRDVTGRLQGRGTLDDPWRVALGGAAIAPELAVWLVPDGPARPPTSAPSAVVVWRPGQPGLSTDVLAQALLAEAAVADNVRPLIVGRPDIAAGLASLSARWTTTDGRIVPPATAADGVDVVRIADVTHDRLADAIDLEELFDPLPDTIVHVAVASALDDSPWPDAPADRVIDLRAPMLAPETFAVPQAATGEWFVALATRASVAGATDLDGTVAQTARLTRVLGQIAAQSGTNVIIADARAGHAALGAAQALLGIAAVVTLGTPLGPVSFTVLDSQPDADALRLLRWLIPAVDVAEPDDADLSLARSMVTALSDLLGTVDPGFELRPPSTGVVAPRSGLVHHAVFGVLSVDAVRRAVTSIVAAGLAQRATARVIAGPRRPVTGVRAGLRLPLAPAATGLVVDGYALVQLIGADRAVNPVDPPLLVTDRAVHVHTEIRRSGGWLAGGPGAGGIDPVLEVRWVEANVVVPFGVAATKPTGTTAIAPSFELVLHEPDVYTIARERWIVRPSADGSLGDEIVTTALPEVRAVLSLVAEVLAEPNAPPAIAALVEMLQAVEVLSPDGGSIPDAIDHLLFDPVAHLGQMLGDSVRRAQLSGAVAALLGHLGGVTVDLAARRVSFDGSGTPGSSAGLGTATWTVHVDVTADAHATFDATVGSAGGTIAGGALVHAHGATAVPFGAEVLWSGASSASRTIKLWPDTDAAGLVAFAARLAPAEIGRAVLEYLRSLDESAKAVIDGALGALGLLGPPPSVGATPPVVLPFGLVLDPVEWFSHAGALGAGAGGFSPARAASLFDALKPLLGVTGGPGEWIITPALGIKADANDGHLRLTATFDSSGLDPIAGIDGRLAGGASLSLTLPPGQRPSATAEVFVGLARNPADQRAAVHAVVTVAAAGPVVSAFLRPSTGADLPLFPNPPGLGQLTDVVLTQALPFLLDTLAAEAGGDLLGHVGAAVRAVGDALALRTAVPKFDGDRLRAWALDPAAALVAALPSLTTTAVQALATAITPMLGFGATASVASGALVVKVRDITVTWTPTPFAVSIAGTVGSIPTVGSVAFTAGLDRTGLRSLLATVGPFDLTVAGAALRPYLDLAVGASPSAGRHIEIGLADPSALAERVGGRWALDGAGFALVTVDGLVVGSDPAAVAAALLDRVLDVVAGFALGATEVQQLLDVTIGSGDVRSLLKGVVLDKLDPTKLVGGLFDPATLLARLRDLVVNLAGLSPSVSMGSGLTVGIAKPANVVQLTLGITDRVVLVAGDPQIALEADSRWIQGQPAAGLALDLVDVGGVDLVFAPGIEVNGIGLRVSKASGPLVEIGPVTLGSVAVHAFGKIVLGQDLAGGVQLQLSDLAVGLAGAQGGNAVASGIMKDSGSGSDRLAPAFSPAVAVQKHGSADFLVSLSAGEGSGPWWLSIQKGFGPVYIEQVGFGVTVEQQTLRQISLFLDGRVSIFGLSASVDDLQLTYNIGQPLFLPSSWVVDVAGFAISADLGGITLAGGLRKFHDATTTRYVGMLLGRFSVYGLSVFGGYSTTKVSPTEEFASFFVFGAVNGPFGGPPAFFLTGIGGGFGINHGLVFPTDLSKFGEFPFLSALDPSYVPPDDPLTQILALAEQFPIKRGEYWFAAGISFTSFALVDGIAVIAVSFGSGLDITLLGVARMALPRPEFPLVSIELALLARFSTSEGVLWIQAQLTDNSWLLNESVRLTGGFAFVTWFGGANKGQFVVTLGGYHPRFSRPGYPEVPRLGFNWNVADAIVIKGENYFALTSEAIMAGGKFEASATFGPAWAHVEFGADGIVYFDPFRFEVDVYARISAGITIDVWIGEITISISIGATIHVEGPNFSGRASFEVGPLSATVSFGDTGQTEKVTIPWDQFVTKYLEQATPGVARVLSAVTGAGALPGASPPDGSLAKPFDVYAEFEFTITTTVPTRYLKIGTAAAQDHPPSHDLAIAPIGAASTTTTLSLSLVGVDTGDSSEKLGALEAVVSATGAYPLGVWGKPQDDHNRPVPAGDLVHAIDTVRFVAAADPAGTLPGEIAYNRLDPPGPRKPLPFVQSRTSRPNLLTRAGALDAVLPDGSTSALVYAQAARWMARANNSAVAIAGLAGSRSAPPRLGSLTEGLAGLDLPRVPVTFPGLVAPTPVDATVHAPHAIALVTGSTLAEVVAPRTTVSAEAPRVAAPTLAGVQASLGLASPVRLVTMPGPAAAPNVGAGPPQTLVASGSVPPTGAARAGAAALDRRGAPTDGRIRLDALTAGLAAAGRARPRNARTARLAERARAAGTVPTEPLKPGEVVVLQLPNSARDLHDSRPSLAVTGAARVLAFAHGGQVLADVDRPLTDVGVPRGSERLVVVAVGNRAADAPAPGLLGWHGGQYLAFVGWSSALAAGCVVRAEGASVRETRSRFRAGWVRAAELVRGTAIVTTRFTSAVRTVAIVLDDPVGTVAERGLSLVLEGARRAGGAGGVARAPSVVASGNRSVLVYSILPDPAAAVVVSVASQDGWHLSGVLGTDASVGDVVDRISRAGIDAAVSPLVVGRTGAVSLSWVPAGVPGAPTKKAAPASKKAAPPRKNAASTRRRRTT